MSPRVPFLQLQPMNEPLRAGFGALLNQVLTNSQYINGSYCKAFEESYAAFTGVQYCTGVSNGLDALTLSLKALGIGVGDEVIVPAHTYIATWLAVTHVGATLVPVDCDRATYTLNPAIIEEKITPRTKCILPVHLYGQPCAMDVIMAIAQKHNLYVVEDNAQAQGATYNGQQTGAFGTINATSFYPGKNLGALGDAGAITTNSAELYNKVCSLKNYGATVKYQHVDLGYNNRLDELQAAFLGAKLPHLNNWNEERRTIAALYSKGLAGIEGIITPAEMPGSVPVFHQYVIRTPQRNTLQQHLAANGVETLIHYPVLPYLQSCYAHLGIPQGSFAVAEEVAATCLSLPIYPGLEVNDIEYVIAVINSFNG